jgi:hypothetical protein
MKLRFLVPYQNPDLAKRYGYSTQYGYSSQKPVVCGYTKALTDAEAASQTKISERDSQNFEVEIIFPDHEKEMLVDLGKELRTISAIRSTFETEYHAREIIEVVPSQRESESRQTS